MVKKLLSLGGPTFKKKSQKTQLFTKVDIVNFKSNLIFLKIAQHGGIIFRDKTPKENVKTRTFQQKYKYLLFLKHTRPLRFFQIDLFYKKIPHLKHPDLFPIWICHQHKMVHAPSPHFQKSSHFWVFWSAPVKVVSSIVLEWNIWLIYLIKRYFFNLNPIQVYPTYDIILCPHTFNQKQQSQQTFCCTLNNVLQNIFELVIWLCLLII